MTTFTVEKRLHNCLSIQFSSELRDYTIHINDFETYLNYHHSTFAVACLPRLHKLIKKTDPLLSDIKAITIAISSFMDIYMRRLLASKDIYQDYINTCNKLYNDATIISDSDDDDDNDSNMQY